MPVKSQNIFKSRDPLVDEPQKTDMTDFSFWQSYLICIGDNPHESGLILLSVDFGLVERRSWQ
jgi:hypothetical protein